MRMIVSDIPDPKKVKIRQNERLFMIGSASLLNKFFKSSTKNSSFQCFKYG